MFLSQIRKIRWSIECDMSVPYRAMTVQIGFSHDKNESDETEFCIKAWDKEELAGLFDTFCKEERCKNVVINSISIVRVATTMDKLTKMEECGGI